MGEHCKRVHGFVTVICFFFFFSLSLIFLLGKVEKVIFAFLGVGGVIKTQTEI